MPSPDLVPYAGEWVAITAGQVAAVGATAAEAETLARRAWPDAALEVLRAPATALATEFRRPRVLDALQAVLAGRPVWLVGGAVRDLLLGREVHDLDFAVDGDALALARRAANHLHGAYFALDAERGNGRAVVTGDDGRPFVVDFAALRADGGLAADLAARDFTINALALPATGTSPDEVIDTLGGRADLLARVIRATGPEAIRQDPNRALRAVRQAAELNFTIDPATRELIQRDGLGLRRVAAERLRDEFLRLLASPRAVDALRALDEWRLLERVVPEVARMRGLAQGASHFQDALEHTFTTVDRVDAVLSALGLAPLRADPLGEDFALDRIATVLRPYAAHVGAHLAALSGDTRTRRALLGLAALLHDCAKPETAQPDAESGKPAFPGHAERGAELALERARALRLSAPETQWVAAVVRAHPMPGWREGYDRRGVYRYFRAAGPAGVDACVLNLADMLAAYARSAELARRLEPKLQAAGALLDGFFNHQDDVIAPPALLTGHELMRVLDIHPGPAVGEILDKVREAQAAGEVRDKEDALALVRRIRAQI